MNTNPSSRNCPECGAQLTQDSPQSLCPACLMRQAFASRTVIGGHDPKTLPPVPTPEEIAGKFPQFDIIECLGRGGMGVVYKARQKSLNRIVAIKVLSPEKGHEARFAERFAREAELLAQLNHPHIVTIHDFGESDGLFYLVMEYVDGVNLRDLLRDGKMEPKQALSIVPPICEALQYAHGKGIVHRDIKPENLLLDRDGRIKIADFGIASLVGSSGEISGTPPYMAPEQEIGSKLTDHRADIYALGVVLYEMLTGERPGRHIVSPSRRVAVDVRIDEMVLRALENEPERRYQTAEEFRTIVETLNAPQAAPPPLPAERKSIGNGMFRCYWWVLPVVILSALVLGAVIGVLKAYLTPGLYHSAATVELKTLYGASVSRSTWDRHYSENMASLSSPLILADVAKRLELGKRWGTNDPAGRLRDMIRIERLRGADLISIGAISKDPDEAREIAHMLTSALGNRTDFILHEKPVAATVPLERDVRATILQTMKMSGLLAPFPALLMMHALHRRRLKKQDEASKAGWWLKAVCLLGIVTVGLMPYLQFPWFGHVPQSVESEDDLLMGTVNFDFQYSDSIYNCTVDVRRGKDSGWQPAGGQPVKLQDGRTMWLRCRVVSNAPLEPVMIVGRSFDGKNWEERDAVVQRDTQLSMIFFESDLLGVVVKWTSYNPMNAR